MAAVVRGEFLYRDVLLVDVGGELKRHPRASEHELKALLNGKKKGNDSNPHHVKDPVGHWWEAQLLHYGLPRSKVKDTCKVRLQQALSQGKLKAQPQHLSDMEAQMKKEYAAAVRKAARPTKDVPAGKKRVREGEGEGEGETHSTWKRTKISLTVGDVSINIDHNNSDSTTNNKKMHMKSVKAATSQPSTSNTTAGTTQARLGAVKNLTGSSTKKGPQVKNRPRTEERPQVKESSTKEGPQVKKESPTKEGPRVKKEPRSKEGSQVKKEPRIEERPQVKKESRTTERPQVKKEPRIGEGPPVKKESQTKEGPQVKKEPRTTQRPQVKKEPSTQKGAHEPDVSISSSSHKREGYLFDADAMDTRPDLAAGKLGISGVYNIECPQITEQLPDKQGDLRFFIEVDNETGVTWGRFELVMKSGVIKMNDIDFNRKLSFGWRARDSWDGELRFGQRCFGEMAFNGAGGMQGIFYSMFNEPCEFWGTRRPGPHWSGMSAYKYQQEWDAFPKEAYGR